MQSSSREQSNLLPAVLELEHTNNTNGRTRERSASRPEISKPLEQPLPTPTVNHPSCWNMFLHGTPRQQAMTPRAILKNGKSNIVKSKMRLRRLRYIMDMFTSLVDAQWRWTLLLFLLYYSASWLIFALLWLLIVFKHGDLEPDHLPDKQEDSNFNPCILNIFDYTSCFLYSLETQSTIGYGFRTITEECPEAIFMQCGQCITDMFIQSYFSGIVMAKLMRPKFASNPIMFSKYAVVCQRDGELCLMFRVGDIRKSNIVGVSVRAQLLRSRTTREGEVLTNYLTELELTTDATDNNLFFVWPATMVHRMNADSPLYGLSATDVLQQQFEIVVSIDATVESTGQGTQARSSYINSEILWGHWFVPMVTYNRVTHGFEIDYSKFDETMRVNTPLCSAEEMELDRVSIGSESDDSSEKLSDRPPSTEPKADFKNGECTVTL